MKKPIVFLAIVAAVLVVAWVLAVLTILLMRWAALWTFARAVIVGESAPMAAVMLAVFVAEALAVLAVLVYTVTRFPETIGAAVDVFSAAKGRIQPNKTRRSTR